MDYLTIVQTTFERQDEAMDAARKIIAARRAACVQVHGPVQSVYHWDGEVRTATEYVLTAKAPPPQAEALRAWLAEHHSYDTPEILSVDARANPAYAQWAKRVCA